MTIQPIGASTLVLYLTISDLQERGLHPDALTQAHTLDLAREGLALIRRTASDPLELESYPDKNGLLLFIHIAPPTQFVWRFMDSDAFLDAALSMPDIITADLYWWNESFWLISTDDSDLSLSEFADLIESDPLLSARLTEYATPLHT